MGRKLEEITATVARERWRFGESEPFTVITEATLCNGSTRHDAAGQPSRLENHVVLKGKTEGGGESGQPEEPAQHFTYRFYGRWTNYENKHSGKSERQFLYDTFVRAQPHTRAGIVKYLDGAPGIGRQLAGKLFDKFGGDAVKILREQPAVAAAAVRGLSEAAAEGAAEWLRREQALEDCTIELVDLLEGRGFPKAVVKQAVKEFGNRAAQVIKDNPYRVMQFRGCGFKRADALYLDLGHPAARLKRQALCAAYHVMQLTRQQGDTWAYFKTAEAGLASAIAGADVRAAAAVELATRGGVMAAMRTEGVDGKPSWDGGCLWLADARAARNEARLAAFVVEAMGE